DRRGVPARRRRVYRGAEQLSQVQGGPLTVGVAPRQAVDQWRPRYSQQRRGVVEGGVEVHLLPLNPGQQRATLAGTEVARLGEAAGPDGADDVSTVHGDLQVVADAAADRAGDVSDGAFLTHAGTTVNGRRAPVASSWAGVFSTRMATDLHTS